MPNHHLGRVFALCFILFFSTIATPSFVPYGTNIHVNTEVHKSQHADISTAQLSFKAGILYLFWNVI